MKKNLSSKKRVLTGLLLLAVAVAGCREEPEPPVITPARETPPREAPTAPEVAATADRVIADFEEMNGWAFSSYPNAVDGYLTHSFGDEPVKEGQYSAKLVYDFSGARGETAAAYAETSHLLPLNWQELSVWVYGDGSDGWLRAEFIDATGAKFVGDLTGAVDWNNSWRECRLRQSDLVGLTDEHARRHPPLALTRIYLVVLPTQNHGAGELYFDTMTLE